MNSRETIRSKSPVTYSSSLLTYWHHHPQPRVQFDTQEVIFFGQ